MPPYVLPGVSTGLCLPMYYPCYNSAQRPPLLIHTLGRKRLSLRLISHINQEVEPRASSLHNAASVYPWCRPVTAWWAGWYTQGSTGGIYTQGCIPTIYTTLYTHHVHHPVYPPCAPPYAHPMHTLCTAPYVPHTLCTAPYVPHTIVPHTNERLTPEESDEVAQYRV